MALTILCLLGLLAFSQAGILKPYFDPRIVNGENAKVGEIPYQVSLQDKYSSFHFCGGSVLSEHYVITAAHCVEGKLASNVKVIAATINLNHPQLTNEVTQIRRHEKYDSSDSWINDVALLKVRDAFVRSAILQYVSLPPKGHVINANDVAVVSGWGRLWQGGPTTEQLQRVNIVIADQGYCANIYNKMGYNVYPTQVCAYDPRVEKGSCHGDSGGPLTVRGVLVGLVSWANGCASTSYPTVYTRVVSHVDWIKSNAV
ncbi:chymotrypsin-2 [Polyergus mexicanus]|uniref:chymotrypsin-2 n=1 Tax=Polyergus mexicanus TaxID=615972 RepID=UPI0038B452CA